jgi:hypothetical protein
VLYKFATDAFTAHIVPNLEDAWLEQPSQLKRDRHAGSTI